MQARDLLATRSTISSSRWLVPLLLIAPIVVIFAPALFADRSFAFRDGAHFYHPLFQWLAREWGAGRVPLWNPQENCGLPILADATSSIFYPGKLLFVLPLPFAWRYKLYIIGHVVLAAISMFAFARRLKASEPAAVLVAVAYACGGNVVFQYCNIVFLIGAAWLPAALLAIEVIVATRCRRAMIGFAVVLALMILGGDPQMAYHALLAGGLRLICSWFATSSPDPSAPALRSTWWQPIPLLAGAAILAFLLAAVQIFPSSEATKVSERAAYHRPRNIYEAAAVMVKDRKQRSLLEETTGEAVAAGLLGQPEPTSHHDRAYNYSISPWRIVEFLWPNVSGRPFPTQRRWTSLIPGDSQPWTPTMYLGLLPFLAGALALRMWRTTPTTRWLSSLVIVFALGSLGWYGLGWFVREGYASLLQRDPQQLSIGSPVGGVYWLMVTFLPTYVYFRYPAKLMPVAVCAMCAIAAPACDRLFSTRSVRWERALQWFAYLSGVLAFAAWVGLSFVKSEQLPTHPTFGPFDLSGIRWDVISAFVHAAVVAWLLRLLLKRIWDATNQESSSTTVRLQWTIVALTGLELAVANYWLIITAPAAMWSETGPVAALIHEQTKTTSPTPTAAIEPRFFRGSYHGWQPASFQQSNSPHRSQELARWEHDTLFPKYHLPSGLPLVESYGSLKSLDYESLLHVARLLSQTRVNDSPLPIPTALRLTNCEYLVLPADAKVSFADKLAPPPGISLPENVSVWRMKRTLPRAWLVPRVVQLPPLANPLDLPAVDQRAQDVLIEKRDGKAAIRDFREVAVVETTAALIPELLNADATFASPTQCDLLLDSPQHIRVRAKLAQPGLLVLADTYAPGWNASVQAAQWFDTQTPNVERQELVVHRTNRCFRGVELSAGEWIVDFEYQPRSFYVGGSISVVAWLMIVLTGLLGRAKLLGTAKLLLSRHG